MTDRLAPARRIPVPASGNINEVDLQPGDYCGPIHGYTGDCDAVFYIPPQEAAGRADGHHCLNGLGHVCTPPHVFRECTDGSLEIRESLGRVCGCSPRRDGYAWHAYLDEGNVWREV